MRFGLLMNDGTTDAIELANAVFDYPFKGALVHQVVTACLASDRQGSRAQKSRSDVRGSGRKPWKQKGTGRARASTIRSPLWRKGGVTFAARPRDYSQKINKKMYRAAICGVFSELVRQKRLLITESFTMPEPRTKALVAKLQQLHLKEVLIIGCDIDVNLYLAARNLYRVAVSEVSAITPVGLIKFERVLMTLSAIKHIEATLA